MQKLYRACFHANENDPRPLHWPIKHPFWVSGYGDDYSTIVAYADSEDYILTNWPEATNIDLDECEGYKFTDRFTQPTWFGTYPQHDLTLILGNNS